MYCSKCGFENKDENQFCEKCGYPLKVVTPPPTPPFHPWRKYISIGAIIIFICFFLPWVTVSCNNNGREVGKASGYELATGNFSAKSSIGIGSVDVSDLPNEGKYPEVFLLLLLGLMGLFSLNGKQSSSTIAIVSGALGLVGLLILMSNFSQIEEDGMFKVNYQFGFIGQWIGNIWHIVAGYMTRSD